ncbi:MAG: RDD family protein [Dehalococcoidia bacterium]
MASLGSRAGAYLIETVGAELIGLLLPIVPLGILIANLIMYRRGQTVGARLLKLRIVRDTGDLAGFYQMFVRAAAAVLSFIPLGLGYWWAFRDEKRQTWHDKLLHTYVLQDTPELNTRPGTSSNSAKVWFWILLGAFIVIFLIIIAVSL